MYVALFVQLFGLLNYIVIHFIMDEAPEIDRFGEILIRIGFTQMVNQL